MLFHPSKKDPYQGKGLNYLSISSFPLQAGCHPFKAFEGMEAPEGLSGIYKTEKPHQLIPISMRSSYGNHPLFALPLPFVSQGSAHGPVMETLSLKNL